MRWLSAVAHAEAQIFVDWLLSAKGQTAIDAIRIGGAQALQATPRRASCQSRPMSELCSVL